MSRGIGYQYQADLVDYSALKRDNSGFTFVLTIIDVFSHIALALPIKSKSGPKVAAALEKAFHVLKSPKKLQTDLGKEFYNKHVQDLLKRNKVHHFSTDQPLKASLVEQFNRTLHETMKQSMAYRKSLRYIDVLPDFLYGYNARPHSAIFPLAPHDVNKNNERHIHKMQYGEYLRAHAKKHKYDIGDKVRKAVSKGIFSKSYKFKMFSDKLYEIVDKVFSNPPMYKLKDLKSGALLDGALYQEQLQHMRDD